MTPVWRNDELEEAVIGALFLRGDDPEVLDVLSRLPASTFSVRQYREIYTGICRQARGGGVLIRYCFASRCRHFRPQFWQPPASVGRNPRCYLTLMCCGAMLVYVMPKQHWKKCWSKSGAPATENQPWPPLKLRSWLYRRSTFQQIPSSPFTSPNCSPQWRTKLNRGARERRDQVPTHWH
jgi:hypothetical protein